jgi:hypothetical protein
VAWTLPNMALHLAIGRLRRPLAGERQGVRRTEGDMPDIFEHLNSIRAVAATKDWNALESKYRATCEELSGLELAAKISALDFVSYEEALMYPLRETVSLASKSEAAAIYFEFDLDNAWSSAFFVCPDYRPEVEGDDDWAAEYDDEVEGPDFPEASDLYLENGFDRSDRAIGATLYLVARTLVALGRTVVRTDCGAINVCAGFHEQDPVVRLQEGA